MIFTCSPLLILNLNLTPFRHSVKALVKEPAISDGRIRPGDKLISANGQDCGAMSHNALISFLRSLPENSVMLRFYRDASRAQTPISTPTESEFSRSYPNLTALNSSFSTSSSGRSKQLRHEAKEMVRSLQVRALQRFRDLFIWNCEIISGKGLTAWWAGI